MKTNYLLVCFRETMVYLGILSARTTDEAFETSELFWRFFVIIFL